MIEIDFYAEKIGPISINNNEDAIASLIKIGDLNSIIPAKIIKWIFLVHLRENNNFEGRI